jgi:4-alpha-glucanotransferase
MRRAGVLLHPSSLAGPEGIGTLGSSARKFLEWVAQAGLKTWQVLPLCEGGRGNSPYSSPSSMVGSRWLIDLAELQEMGLLSQEAPREASDGPVSYDSVKAEKESKLREAARRLRENPDHPLHRSWQQWREAHPALWEVARFQVVRGLEDQRPWWEWSPPLRNRQAEALEALDRSHIEALQDASILAFLFDQQWSAIRRYAEELGIEIFGDLPIYVAPDSAEIWSDPGLFDLDAQRRPLRVAGVPPDAFSATGQLWKNPLYDWESMAAHDYSWWVQRVRRSLEWCSLLRLDHFRGFAAYWAVPAHAPTAESGRWLPGPGRALFERIREELGPLPLVAEDLGDIDEAVHQLRKETGLHCTRVLHFGFETDTENIHLPMNWARDTVGYSATHDNDTTAGWWSGLDPAERQAAQIALGISTDSGIEGLLRASLDSEAERVVLPMQDILELGSEARMNTPGTLDGNWAWRMGPRALHPSRAQVLRDWLEASGRV